MFGQYFTRRSLLPRKETAITHLPPNPHKSPNQTPDQQPHGASHKDEDHDLVFGAVALETRGHDVGFQLHVLANGQIIREAELSVAVCAGALFLRIRF